MVPPTALTCVFLTLILLPGVLAEPSDRVVDTHPAWAPLSPEESMKRLRLPPGFCVELVASEPLIREPVALTWDGNGRMYVVEMRGYMQDLEATGAKEPVGRISRLEDTNGDGKMDTHSAYLDGLIEPRAILAIDDGLLVGEPPDLWFCQDGGGDGVADIKRHVTDKFSLRDSNVEHKANSLTWGMDNWIHVSQHGRRYQVIEETIRHESVPSVGQWGLTRNDEGRFIFSTNSNPGMCLFVPPRYLSGAAHKDSRRTMTGAIHRNGGYDSVWPAMVTPDLQSGPGAARKSDGTLRHFTSACGQTIFRGDRLGEDMQGDYFICEPVGRLVRRSEVRHTESGHIELTNRFEKDLGEFITSTDGNFRPVNAHTGPDGCLYIVDMYRGVVQEKAFLTPYLREEILRAGYDKNVGRGRIYRVVRDGMKRGPRPKLLEATPKELAEYLGHPNGWWRDTAQSLLVTRQVQSVTPTLKKMALEHEDPLAQLHALWTLDGIGQLDRETILSLTRHHDSRIRIAAVRTMDPPGLYFKRLEEMLADSSPLVISQIVLTAGQSKEETSRYLIAKCLAKHPTHAQVIKAVEAVAPRELVSEPASHVLALDKQGRSLFDRGRTIYVELCTACHGSNGQGIQAPNGSLAPPLPGSPRLTQAPDVAVRILLHGLTGRIDGKDYEGLMAPFGATQSDEWVASVLTYTRREWGNQASTILPADVAKVREHFHDRQTPWTQTDLEEEPSE